MAFYIIVFACVQYYIYRFSQDIITAFWALFDSIIQFAPNLKTSEIIYFDFETTGLNPYHEKIIDYAFLVEDSGETFIESLIDPECKFEKKITDITGIHPEDLEGKPVIRQELDNIYNFINHSYKQICYKHVPNRFLVAHNCDGFDKIFLMEQFKDKPQYPLIRNWHFIDTLPLAKKLLPNLNSHSLKSLATYYKVKPGTHRALSDTKTLRNVFNELIDKLSNEMCISKSTLIEDPQLIIDYYSY
jgi:DNA polymerase III alpha subunit (gram-positive type)